MFVNSLLRKLRGALGIGLTWGVLWAAIGFLTGVIIGIVDPDSIDPGESPLIAGAIVGVVGFISGVGFSVLLSLTEARKSIRDLSPARAALWGMLGAAALPLLTGMPNQLALITCPLGAVFAGVSVAIARRGERRELEQLARPDSARLSP